MSDSMEASTSTQPVVAKVKKSRKEGKSTEEKVKKEKKSKKSASAPAQTTTATPDALDSSPEKTRAEVSGSDAGKDAEEEDPNVLTIDPDAPAPLSKKQLRKAKSKQTLGDEAEEGLASAPGNSSSKPKGQAVPQKKYSVWIGNLAFKTTEQQLRYFFERALNDLPEEEVVLASSSKVADMGGDDGAVTATTEEKIMVKPSITRVNLPKSNLGKGKWGPNKGFAYVDFSTPSSLEAALKLTENPLDGRKVLIKKGEDFSSRPETPVSVAVPVGTKSKTVALLLSKQKNPVGATLFVGNLGFEATEDAIRALIETHYQTSMAKDKKAKSAFRPEPVPLSMVAEAEAEEAAAAATSGSDGEDSDDADDENKEKGGEEEEKAALMKKVGPQKKEEDIVIESGAGIRKIRMGQFQDTGRCKGFAFIDFLTPAQATAALIDMRNHRLDGRNLTLQYASPAAAARSGTTSKNFNTPIRAANSSIDAPLSSNAFVDMDIDVEAYPEPLPESEQAEKVLEGAAPPKKKKRLMKKEREAAREAAGLPPTIPVDAPNNPRPPPKAERRPKFAPVPVAAELNQTTAAAEPMEIDYAHRPKRAREGEEGEGEERKMAKWEQKRRPAPGSALANAQRAPTGIVKSEGKKVVFD